MINVNSDVEINSADAKRNVREILTDPMGGWAELPLKVDYEELERVKETAVKIQSESEVLVCIGIGGSYLGHRAIIEALRPKGGIEIVYAGNSLSRRELDYALEQVGEKDFSVNVISKSGTTLEPAIAFEKFKKKLVEKYGEAEAYQRIYATTDATSGTLHDEAVQNGYTRFVVPDNVGGRYSVLTSVGLLPLAVAGVDVDELISGAAEMAKSLIKNPAMSENDGDLTSASLQENITKNPMMQYAYMRNALAVKGYDTEVFASFEPATAYFNEWLKQLFGESEGKNQQGVWPASVVYSTDLHSLGQFMQDGRRNLWETIIDFPTDELNEKVVKAVKIAHAAGGIPVLTITVPSYDENGFGQLIYFFEMSCAVSAKLSGVNPFDQPGVEKYKSELKKML
ncbi:glucose-6-phosphate isomerase [Candidatus Saccharibacteria bacterium]|nr:glucose-6-phosphate isomerase [Candidatus Saccharibacteria bacterium]